MQTTIIVALSLHILAATFWAGTTFVLARAGGKGADRLIGPQLGAATVAILTGAYLGHLLHAGSFETPEKLLAAGAACALIAFLVQLLLALGLRGRTIDDIAISRMAAGERFAAVLLAVTTVCMAAARYA
jgi:uncharacterized membrane protein